MKSAARRPGRGSALRSIASCRTDNLHGEPLSSHSISHASPGAPDEKSRRSFVEQIDRKSEDFANQIPDSPASPLQRILHPWRSRLNQPPQLRLQLLHLALHLPGDPPIAEMSLHSAAEPGDILRLGEIHFEQ